ncbi:MAG: VanZ family protein [Lachnospiraceae bacterium]|nr:VanZ family protein [Lachnospiraceae bacterium]
MKKTEKLKAALRFIPAVLWMGMIYWFSAQPADISTEESFTLASQIVEFYAGFSGMEEPVQLQMSLTIEPFLRKAAHMSEYALLAVLLYSALKGLHISYRRAALISLLICILYSCTDEWHQTFVFGRSGSIRDVIIDTLGAAVALSVIFVKAHRDFVRG